MKATRDATRDLVLAAIAHQGGEWTPGRVKRLYAQHNLTHVWRRNIRRLLAQLCAEGHLTLHDSPARRFYTPGGGE
ncbi:hypothetical protein [Streptacidiphilus carbonis]|uniref:hypothetical protein n=1 Tax=Streptacidiphilus carbonis TaxID=105422 RepID=UPI0005A8066A|nr:hypothetical protein [Streptacidiphilus carbonis]